MVGSATDQAHLRTLGTSGEAERSNGSDDVKYSLRDKCCDLAQARILTKERKARA